MSLQESLTILPGVLAPDALKEALLGVDAAVVMKVGRHLADQAWYVERASGAGERVLPLADTDGVDAPYFSLVLVPGAGLAQRYPDRR